MALLVLIRLPEAPTGSALSLIVDAPRIVVGRGKGCEVQLPDPTVSARHASIRQRGREHLVVDEGSTNGTIVGGVKLPPQTPHVLRDGAWVRIGRVWLECRHTMDLPSSPDEAERVARDFVAVRLGARGEQVHPCIEIVEGPAGVDPLVLGEPDREYLVGRGSDLDLTLDDPELARRHISVVRTGSGCQVRDLGSGHGSRLDDELLTIDGAPWRHDQIASLGACRLRLVDPMPAMLAELRRSPDERMRSSEYAERPPAEQPPAEQPSPEPDPDVAAAAEPAEPPPAAEPQPSAPEWIDDEPDEPDSEQPDEARGYRAVEILVVLLALGLIAASALGLAWLFR